MRIKLNVPVGEVVDYLNDGSELLKRQLLSVEFLRGHTQHYDRTVSETIAMRDGVDIYLLHADLPSKLIINRETKTLKVTSSSIYNSFDIVLEFAHG